MLVTLATGDWAVGPRRRPRRRPRASTSATAVCVEPPGQALIASTAARLHGSANDRTSWKPIQCRQCKSTGPGGADESAFRFKQPIQLQSHQGNSSRHSGPPSVHPQAQFLFLLLVSFLMGNGMLDDSDDFICYRPSLPDLPEKEADEKDTTEQDGKGGCLLKFVPYRISTYMPKD